MGKKHSRKEIEYEHSNLEKIMVDFAQKLHLVDNHARILFAESDLDLKRISNLRSRWEAKANEGLLPITDETGIFNTLTTMAVLHRIKLNTFFDSRLMVDENLYQKYTRSFEDIIELTDELANIHKLLAYCERCFWQRMEGFEGGAIDAVRRGTVSEVGAIQQVYNAADFLCLSLADKIKPLKKVGSWKGLTVFGQQHEFSHYEDLIFAPDYVKLHSVTLWLYFAHEVAHYAIRRILKQSEDFVEVFEELKIIFSEQRSSLKRHGESEYLAEETVADVLATLMVGEQYLLTLTDMKYYPSIIVGERKHYTMRSIQYPTLLRVLVCNWTTKIAWGFGASGRSTESSAYEDDVIRRTIGSVLDEDLIEHTRARLQVIQPRKELERKLGEGFSATKTTNDLEDALFHERKLAMIIIPRIMGRILNANVIPRLKSIVEDFYGTPSDKCHSNARVDFAKPLWKEQVMTLDSACLVMSESADLIIRKKEAKRNRIKNIKKQLVGREIVRNKDPRDIIFSIAELSRENPISAKIAIDRVAVISISHAQAYRSRRFEQPGRY
jgi:hypothetical protein